MVDQEGAQKKSGELCNLPKIDCISPLKAGTRLQGSKAIFFVCFDRSACASGEAFLISHDAIFCLGSQERARH
jgi:hypothetical protein